MGTLRRPVVVGVGGRRSGRSSLDWATDEATRWGIPLSILHSRALPPDAGSALPPAGERTRADVVRTALTRALARSPGLDVTSASTVTRPAVALVEASRSASCVVVGARELGPAKAGFLSATPLEVAAHAACPVVVVREQPRYAGPPDEVVVGIDSSGETESAIAYALAQASARHLPLTLVHVWAAQHQDCYLTTLDLETVTAREQSLMDDAVANWAEKYPDVRVNRLALWGHPVKALADRSVGSALLVVGSRGGGGFSGMLLGSVCQGVLQQARCPVAVVPPGSRPGD